jgi:hypothetical protein
MPPTEFAAGPSQAIVVYQPADTGVELDPMAIYRTIAEDAEARAAAGWRIVSIADMPLRHGGEFMGLQGSGHETKAAVAVVYARS